MKMSDVHILNPLSKDVTVGWGLNDKNPKRFILKNRDVTPIPQKYAEHVKKVLGNKIFDERGDISKDREMQMKKIYKKIIV